MRNAVVVAYGRSAVAKAPKGKLKNTRPDEVTAQVLKSVLDKIPQLDHKEIDDFVLGCAFQEAEQGFNMAKVVLARAGLPIEVSGQTVGRFCSSGLQSIATAANSIMAGQADVMIAGGVESMSIVPMGGNIISPNPYLMENSPENYMSMGITAENVAKKYGITREMADTFAVESHEKATKAQAEGRFDEIIPVEAIDHEIDQDGNVKVRTFTFNKDEGVRPGSTVEKLGKLRTVFQADGVVTAANSSQMSDGAAIVVLMSEEKAKELGLKPIAAFRSFAVAGVEPELMGIGPIKAIPKALKIAGIGIEDLDLIELNEAFATQSLACISELGLNKDIVNVNGGAISMGHPLGATGSVLTCKLLSEMSKREGSKYGLVSMCIGGGMGAAGVFELL